LRKSERLGSKLKSSAAGGDYRDLPGFLGLAGVGISEIDGLLTERNRLVGAIHDDRNELARLGISQV